MHFYRKNNAGTLLFFFSFPNLLSTMNVYDYCVGNKSLCLTESISDIKISFSFPKIC